DPEDAERERALSDGKPWRYVAVVDRSRGDSWRWRAARVRRRVGLELHRRAGYGNVWQLGYCAPEMLALCRRRKPDLAIVHLEQALWVGRELLRRGVNVGIDVEDWYSEDQLPADRRDRPVALLRKWERELLLACRHKTTTSHALSEALAAEYGCEPPAVVYNGFPLRERETLDRRRERSPRGPVSLHWYSQTIGPGRGLEVLVDALEDRPVEVHLRGTLCPGYDETLRRRAAGGMRERIFFHPQVPHHELLARVAEHDVGVAAEIGYCRNKDLTISNKILHYLLAGVPVIASDTAGQREVAELCPEAVRLYRQSDPKSLARALDELLSDRDGLRRRRAAAWEAAERHFCWERSEPVLLESVERALSSAPTRSLPSGRVRCAAS
ncbi:MAG TPA: glycosyltransferase, partial [Planctomycetaceae bacterium]